MNSHTEEHKLNRYFGLDLIRAIAIILVLISHFIKIYEYIGFWGVELFFGLSGFLIGTILWRNFSENTIWGTRNIINFWSRRWWRTLPNYYLFLVISVFFHYLLDHALPPYKQLVNFLWFGQDFLNRSSNFYGVSWSLCIEEWFYLTFPLILYFFAKTGLSIKASFVLSIVFIISFCFLVREILDRYDGIENLHMITVARLDAIAIGVFISFTTSVFYLSSKMKLTMLITGLIMIACCISTSYVFNISQNTIVNNKYLLLIAPLGSSLLLPYFKTLNRPIYKFRFFAEVIERLSIWSYSIYLSHIPILFTSYYVTSGIRSTFIGNVFSKILGLILTILFSAFLYNFFELPMMAKRPKELAPALK
ncbi:acyltransferase [Spirosoma sp. 48-14]|uniref:acyltransferase family protein n=1 Tax=Spirosoma sp. 48-14 TaxID=1895854 RepID=UPI00096044D0|nr:acyltransferase [Spirosoma sp. 48-14]OJW75083.1 MAG: hypothetical protein BGO59_19115 [Spirosoma sp. 48-14]